MQTQKGTASLFALLAVGGIAIGFGLGYFVANKNKSAFVGNQEEVVALFNNTGVTAEDAYPPIKSRIHEMETALYDMKKKAILEHIQSRLLEEEASKAKMPLPLFLAKNINAEIKDPTEKEVNDYLLSRGLKPKDRRINKEEVKRYLKNRASSEKREAFLEKLTSNAKIKFFINEPSENKVSLSLDGYATWGNKDAPVTVVEYSDFPCANCAKNTETMEKLKKEYGPDKVKIVFAENPTPSHPRAYPSANAARCANEQGKFSEMRTLLFQNPNKLDDANLKDYAKNIGLDMQKFNDCFDKKQYSSQIEKSKQQAVKQGILAMPTIIVNGTLIRGLQSFEKIKEKIDENLEP